MLKSALGILLSLCCVIAVPAAQAENSVTPAASKKQSSKNSFKKHKTKKPTAQVSLDRREKLVRRVVSSNGRRKVVYQRVTYAPRVPVVPPVVTAGDLAGLRSTHDPLALKSNVAYVVDQNNSQVLFEKNANVALPIASITKLMTGLVVVEAHQDMNEVLEITADDIDREKHSSSRLQVGSRMTRADLLHIALMSSENRAASALGRNYPGGLQAFVAAMNAKARVLGMNDTHFVDSTGLSSLNVSSARDLAKLVIAAHDHPIICRYSTDQQYVVNTGRHSLQYKNSNHLVLNPTWEIGLQKTGYISEAGRCMVVQATVEGRQIVMVFLDAKSKESRMADAGRIRKWLEAVKFQKGPITGVTTQS
ncbi:MAG TPA: D-alanyl-D-alanine endopeptidase [Paucimonas sp.]|nr:D-alanyl-D-alanine endopeptidase [Paucimonas sp.]